MTIDARTAINDIVISAQEFTLQLGSPTLSTSAPANRNTAWLLDGSTNAEQIGAVIWIPDHWNTCIAELLWANALSGAGDARFVISGGMMNLNNTLTSLPTGLTSVLIIGTAGAQWVLKRSESTQITVSEPGNIYKIAIQRDPTQAADTLANDVAIYALRLRRTS